MPRPRSLTEAEVSSAALAVLDGSGLAALSMRAVAQRLGMGTMSLYRYVQSRQQLEGLIVELVLSGIDLDLGPAARGPWQDRLGLLMARARAAAAEHPNCVPLLLTHRHSAAGSRDWGEALLGALTDGGFAGVRRVAAFRALLSYLIGALQVEHLGPLSGPGTAALAGLPQDAYPLLSATARDASALAPEAEFRQGLDLLLAGLAVQDTATASADPTTAA
ncbi:MAG TPA: TetR/AcrR family transcriptional regulator C-terminal domain-containing protein [Actinocrinis sp.]|jgi:AcrR family transcriptional regulator